jgi:hypothetical protein
MVHGCEACNPGCGQEWFRCPRCDTLHTELAAGKKLRDLVLEAAVRTIEDLDCDWQDEGLMQDKALAALRAMKGAKP